jgi:biotin carboxyl carrier protein
MIPNVQAAIVVEYLDASIDDQAVAFWPSNTINCEMFFNNLPLLKAQLSPVVTMGKQIITERDAGKTPIDTLIIAYPLSPCADFSGAVILEVAAKAAQQTVLLQMLKWGQSWLQLLLENSETTSYRSANDEHITLKTGVEVRDAVQSVNPPLTYFAIVQAVLSCSDHQQAIMTLVNEISRCWLFERVSLGVLNGNEIEVKALSHSAHFDVRSNLIVTMQQAMTEVQHKPGGLCFPCSETADLACYSGHQRLLIGRDDNVLLSLPLQENDQTVAVLLCELQGEADETHQLASQTLAELNILAGLLGPLVRLHQRGSQSIPEHIVDRSRARLTLLHQGRFGKLPLVGGLIFMLLMTGVIKSDFRVSTEATLEGRIQRAVVAPFDGYVDTVFARAGDQVEEGDVIAQLDDQPLQLEKRGWLSKKEEYQKQYRQELASLSHAKARIIKAQIAQADVHIAQVDSRLQRAKLVSPLSGMIIEGDLSRSLGAPVEQGQVLFEVAPLDDYRVVLKIHERDIAYLQRGQTGSLMLTAYPNESIPLTVEQVAIVYEQEGDYTWYRTEASIPFDHLPSAMLLRPGMEGLGKIEVGQKSIAWIGLHRLTDWLRLWFWSWTP